MDWWYDKMVNGDVYEYSTAGTYSVTVPNWGANVAVVTACGAGGGGGGAGGVNDEYNNGDDYGGGGGAGAKVVNGSYTVTAGQKINITVGKGGAGGYAEYGSSNAIDGTAGGAGGSTKVGSLVTLAGGAGGATGVYERESNGADSIGAGGAHATSNTAATAGKKGGGGGGGYPCYGSSTAIAKYAVGAKGGDGYVKIAFKYDPTK